MRDRTHLIIGDSHATPKESNRRADWLAKLISDVRPTTIIHIGDSADMESLCSYDRGTKSFEGRRYKKDIEAHLDFTDRALSKVKKKVRSVFMVGNHEQRIVKAISVQPELEGAIGLKDLQLEDYYDEVVEYSGTSPGINVIDGICYSHYLSSGIMGRAISGEYHALSLIKKQHVTCVVGHSHLGGWAVHTNGHGKKIYGVVVGCYFEHFAAYAGSSNDMFWRGIVVLRNVSQGEFDTQFIRMDTIKREYA